MEVLQDSYKETKIGRIPETWKLQSLDQLKAPNTTITYGVVKPGPIDELGVLFVRGGDVKNGKISNELRTISKEVSAKYKRTLLKGGELLVSLVGYPGECAIVPDCLNGANIARQVGYIKLSEHCDKHFIQQYLSSERGKKNLLGNMVGSAQQVINLNMLRNVNIPLPPLPEQQKIAEILSTVDEQISATERIIEKSKGLKKGLMQKFFLNKAYMIMSLGRQEQTDLVPIQLKSLGQILTGTTPSTKNEEYYDPKEYMFIGPSDLGVYKSITESNKGISEKGFQVSRKLPKNAVMTVCIGATIGKVGLASEPCATNQQINSIIPKKQYNSDYIYYLILGIRKYLLEFAGDTATPQLNKTDFSKVVTFIHEDENERNKIASILSEVDIKIEKEEQYKSELEQLKKGLMQQLLTGQKRVKV